MKYANDEPMRVGDHVTVDGMTGILVCDFDNRKFLDGYADGDIPEDETLVGVMIHIVEAGLVQYETQQHGEFRRRASRGPARRPLMSALDPLRTLGKWGTLRLCWRRISSLEKRT
jgi:hypothetical protein